MSTQQSNYVQMTRLESIRLSDIMHVLAKCEFECDSGSHKQRVYSTMIDHYESRGLIKPGDTLVDFSSGNGAIALASLAANHGYKAVVVVPSTISVEKRNILAKTNAEVHEVPAQAPDGYLGPDDLLRARLKAARIAESKRAVFLDQSNNPLNADACEAIGLEILDQIGDVKPDYLVCGIGTGGTITGIARVLKSKFPEIKVIGVEPSESTTVRSRLSQSEQRHDAHRLSGLGAGEISAALDLELLDECVEVDENEWVPELVWLQRHNHLVGKSSAAALAAIRKIGDQANCSSTFVTVFFDSIDRYKTEFEAGYCVHSSDLVHTGAKWRRERLSRSALQFVINNDTTPCRLADLGEKLNSSLISENSIKVKVARIGAAGKTIPLTVSELEATNEALGATPFRIGRFPSCDSEGWITLEKSYSTFEQVIDAVRTGTPVIVLDEREEEGDFMIACEVASQSAINLMLKEGRGVLCVALTPSRFSELGLRSATALNTAYNETPFGESVDYLVGTTTGVSALDRSRTVRALGDPGTRPNELRHNGHVRTLEAHPEGLGVRMGHTEALVDLTRAAGFEPAGCLIEILNKDGTMAREQDLLCVATRLELPIIKLSQVAKHICASN